MVAMTLTEFLLARIAVDEAAARVDLAAELDGTIHASYGAAAERTLARCAAHRRIVELHHPLDGGDPETYPWTDETGRTYWPECAECAEKHVDGRGCATLRALAVAYADHHDFEEGWKL